MPRPLQSWIACSCLTAVLAACGAGAGGTASSPGTSHVLHLAYYADMSTPDPDVFYDIEGLTVILSAYDNLVRYRPESHDLQPDLATSWSTSADGLTYTFTLRPGVRFSDGTPCDSSAIVASFERRVAVGAAPAYMLANVDHYETPSPTTLVIKLKTPVSAFLDYLASAWGPKAISPTALRQHAGNDHAQTWLSTHSAGTGPFLIASFQRGRRYTLVRNPHYWGPQPYFDEVDTDIVPDFATQRQKLERGDLDVILHAYPVAELDTVKSNPQLVERDFSSYLMPIVYFNPARPGLGSATVRHALVDAMDLPTVVREDYGRLGSLAHGVYPQAMVDPSIAPITYGSDPSAARGLLPSGRSLDMAYVADESGVQRRAAELMSQGLQRAGINATVREVQPAQAYDFAKDLTHAPDILVATNTPDAAHPDTWARILWGTGGGLNFFAYSNPAIDAALDRGLRETSPSAALQDYGLAGRLLAADWTILPFANIADWMVMRTDLSHVEHVPNYAWYLDLGHLGRR